MSTSYVHWTAPDGSTHLAGRLDELPPIGLQRFTYDNAWLTGPGFPLGEGLPLEAGPLAPPGGATSFGLFLDAGPDAWGRRVIARKVRPMPATATGFILAAGDEPRQGALRFSAQPDGPFLSDGGPEPLGSLDELYREVQQFQRDESTTGQFGRLLRAGTSQGGFRPKAVVADPDGALWIAKFPSETDTYDVETCEAAALDVARQAGLAVPEFQCLRLDDQRAILLVRRFDRTGNGRLGYQSMRTASRLGSEEYADYQTMAAAAGYLCGVEGRRAILGAATLNIAVNNIDDHARNFGFLQAVDGQWRPAPLFDIVPHPRLSDGTPVQAGVPVRSLEQVLGLDWAVPQAADLVRRVAQAAAQVYRVGVDSYGLDAEFALAAERYRSSVGAIGV